MAEARWVNSGDVWPLRLAGDNGLTGDGFISVAGQSSCEILPARRDSDASPTKVKAPLDLEPETQVATFDALASVEPGTKPTWLAAATEIASDEP